jgi:hypothetical protein
MTHSNVKTLCMVYTPANRQRFVSDNFPALMLYSQPLQYVNYFNYLGRNVQNYAEDDGDVRREIRDIYCRCNMLIRRFNKCLLMSS